MLARRFSCPPVHEAVYEPREVPNCAPDLEGTLILRPRREEWLSLLGEMVQMTNEAVRRRAKCGRDASKPLSLEYMADRIDVDDPLFGYLAVTKDKGWMQGYVTCTTFTTWHRGFKWDSTNPELELQSHGNDEAENATHSPAGSASSAAGTAATSDATPARLYDADGSLSADLMREVFSGDPDGEGVVWPRVAELSLLGALGCGRWLVQLIIDGLEQPDSPYRYVVTQATDGSIPFYERMGFVRVGALTATPREPASPAVPSSATKRQKLSLNEAATEGEMLSRSFEYTCDTGDTCASVAAAHDVEAFEVVFLNFRRFKELHQHAPLLKGTKLHVPRPPTLEEVREEQRELRQSWVVLEEDESLKKVSERCGVPAKELLELNKGHIKGLQLSSILRRGSRIQTAGISYDISEYCHWTFPDDDASTAPPSYMMARRLKPFSERVEVGSAKARPVKAGVGKPNQKKLAIQPSTLEKTRQLLAPERPRVVPSESRRLIFEKLREAETPTRGGSDGEGGGAAVAAAGAGASAESKKLYNQVVRIDGESGAYEYWFVLTYLPDLQWCHVAPLEKRGTFGAKHGASAGRPKWMLVAEEHGGEIDVGAGRCHIVQAKEMRSTKENADEEEWDIVGEDDE